jgi:hypothetical protein
VHPYNSFETINIDVSLDGKITIKIKKIYSDKQIEFINNHITNFINTNLNLSMNNLDKIKAFHNHIINQTRYDQNNTFESYTAYNLLTSGISICGGYSDIMAIYLNAIGIKNYRITSSNHIWNLVEIDGIWYHLDVTWDDPIASDGKQYLIHNFFIIPTTKLFELDKVEHNFDNKTYILKAPADESPLDIDKCIEFCKKLDMSSEKISNSAKKYTWYNQMKKVADELFIL